MVYCIYKFINLLDEQLLMRIWRLRLYHIKNRKINKDFILKGKKNVECVKWTGFFIQDWLSPRWLLVLISSDFLFFFFFFFPWKDQVLFLFSNPHVAHMPEKVTVFRILSSIFKKTLPHFFNLWILKSKRYIPKRTSKLQKKRNERNNMT